MHALRGKAGREQGKTQPALPERLAAPHAEGIRKERRQAEEAVSWMPFSRDEFLEMARRLIKKAGIKKRWELKARFASVYDILRERRMLDDLFGKASKGAGDQLDDFQE